MVQRVHPEITPDEFMSELYEMNLKDRLSEEVFKKNVRLVTGPWKAGGGPVNVVLEGNADTLQHLVDIGRCYIKWFSFPVRQHTAVYSCFRCLSFDHMVLDCKMASEVCRLCGIAGHIASRCQNDARCRNCAFKGLPAGHLMIYKNFAA